MQNKNWQNKMWWNKNWWNTNNFLFHFLFSRDLFTLTIEGPHHLNSRAPTNFYCGDFCSNDFYSNDFYATFSSAVTFCTYTWRSLPSKTQGSEPIFIFLIFVPLILIPRWFHWFLSYFLFCCDLFACTCKVSPPKALGSPKIQFC